MLDEEKVPGTEFRAPGFQLDTRAGGAHLQFYEWRSGRGTSRYPTLIAESGAWKAILL